VAEIPAILLPALQDPYIVQGIVGPVEILSGGKGTSTFIRRSQGQRKLNIRAAIRGTIALSFIKKMRL